MGRKVVFGVIIFLYVIEVLALAAGHGGEVIRPDLAAAQLLALVLPIRSLRPDGTKLYSAMVYRVASIPGEHGRRVRRVQFYPRNFEPWKDT